MVSVNKILIINVILVVVALILHVVGFATPGWIGNSVAHSGLWQSCYKSTCGNIKITNHKFRAVRAMECLALICYIVAAVLGVLAILKLGLRKKANKLMGLLVLVGFVFAIIGVIIYGVTYKNNLYYSFGLTIVAFIIAFVAGLLALWNDRHYTEITT